MSKRKSCRPCNISVGTVSEWSLERTEREASTLLTAAVTLPASRSVLACVSEASHCEKGTADASWASSPPFGTPFGLSAVPRSVQAMAGTIALNGTPAAAALHTAPPPRERPKAPICVSETSLRAASQSNRSCASCTSFGPSSPNVPPEAPVPRASQASEAKPTGAKAALAIVSITVWLWPSPWKSSSPGQPPGGGLPPGRMSPQASVVPSETLIVSSCVAARAADADPPQTNTAIATARRTRARPTGARYRPLYDARHGSASRRRLRLRSRWSHRSARVPRDHAERGLRLPRRPRAPAVRPASARGDPALRARDRRLSRGAGREAHPRRVQRRDLGCAAAAPGGADGSGGRRAHAGGTRGRADDAEPARRTARHRGNDRRGSLRRARARA